MKNLRWARWHAECWYIARPRTSFPTPAFIDVLDQSKEVNASDDCPARVMMTAALTFPEKERFMNVERHPTAKITV
jgi:hypothetical protein